MKSHRTVLFKPDPEVVEVDPKETWMRMRAGPGFDQFIQLAQAMLVTARTEYIEQAASEFNRGRVNELVRLCDFLKSGELNGH